MTANDYRESILEWMAANEHELSVFTERDVKKSGEKFASWFIPKEEKTKENLDNFIIAFACVRAEYITTRHRLESCVHKAFDYLFDHEIKYLMDYSINCEDWLNNEIERAIFTETFIRNVKRGMEEYETHRRR